jgi:hypothetical protein
VGVIRRRQEGLRCGKFLEYIRLLAVVDGFTRCRIIFFALPSPTKIRKSENVSASKDV